MPKIYLSLDLHRGGRVPKYATLANIYDITPNREVKKNKQDLLIPSYPDSSGIDLSPGRYIVEYKLPSGRLLKEEVEVENQDQEVTLYIPTPHEHLGMQVLMGNIKQSPEVFKGPERSTYSRFVSTWVVSSKSPRSRSKLYLGSKESKIERGYFYSLPEFKEKPRLHKIFPSVFPPKQYTGPLKPYRDEIIDNFNLNMDWIHTQGESGFISRDRDKRERVFNFNGRDFARTYLWTQIGSSTQYSVIPIPWRKSKTGYEANIEVSVNREKLKSKYSKNYADLHRISIVVEDRVFASLIGYLGRGDLHAASIIVDKAEGMLFGKRMNPFAAAAGSYILLSQRDLTEYQDWLDWVNNLMHFFDWLPDGAIQLAWLKMAKSHPDIGEIREILLEAYWRGLPYYSTGVKLLLDELTIFSDIAMAAGEPDVEIEEALKNIRELAMRTDMNQPFTSVIIN